MDNPVIKKTKDYDLFKTIEGNRKIYKTHVKDLTLAIMKNNLLAYNPILVNERMEIIDGQHRLEVAKNNNLDIYYIVGEALYIDEMRDLNSNTRSWNMRDYVESWAIKGNKNYQWLIQFAENFRIPFTPIITFISGKEDKALFNRMRSGRMELNDVQKAKAEERAVFYSKIHGYLNHTGQIPRGFIVAVTQIYDSGLGDKLLRKLEQDGVFIRPEHYALDAKLQLEEIIKG